MEKIINILIEQIRLHGVSAVFFGSLIEEAVAPIPSPAVMMGSGFILLEKYQSVSPAFVFDLLKIALIGGIGALVGSYVIYALGYFGGKPVIEKTKGFTGLKWNHIEKFQAKLESGKRDEVTIAMLRAIPVMPAVVISGSCGLLRVNIFSYSISFYIGGVIRNIIFLIIGWKIGNAYSNLAHSFDSLQNIVTILIAVAMVAGLGYLYWKRGKAEQMEENTEQNS